MYDIIYINRKERGWLQMKRVFQIIKPFVFIAIFCILFINVSYILRYESDIKERFMGFYAEENNTIDMVMIGSSPVHPHWGGYWHIMNMVLHHIHYLQITKIQQL